MRLRYIVGVLLLVAAPLRAQSGPAQDSTLIGLRLVQLTFVGEVEDRATLRESMALELRKAGLRVLPDSAQPGTPVDAIITVLLREITSGAKVLRMSVWQRVQITRTTRAYQLPTWFYDVAPDGVRGGNSYRREWWRDAVRQAGDVFLTKWLDVNGR